MCGRPPLGKRVSGALTIGSGTFMCPASHDEAPVNGFVLVIRGELSSCRPVCEPHIRRDPDPNHCLAYETGELQRNATNSVKTAPRRHAGQQRCSLGHRAAMPSQYCPISSDCYADGFMIAPSGTTPSTTNRHRAISSLRARATTITLRTRRPVEPVRSRNQATCATPGW